MRRFEEEVYDDFGLSAAVNEHIAVAEYSADGVSFIAGALEEFRRHRKGIAQLGALGVGALGAGFASGALVFSHRAHPIG